MFCLACSTRAPTLNANRAKINANPAVSGLRLRDYVLGGGEIHMSLSDDNRVPSDPGYWYASKCNMWPKSKQTNDRIGVIVLRQLDAQGNPRQTIELDLEDLDTAHILDRLRGEALELHAQTCGPGPRAKPATPKP